MMTEAEIGSISDKSAPSRQAIAAHQGIIKPSATYSGLLGLIASANLSSSTVAMPSAFVAGQLVRLRKIASLHATWLSMGSDLKWKVEDQRLITMWANISSQDITTGRYGQNRRE
jgi:hypothetical protein